MLSGIHAWRLRRKERQAAKLVALAKGDREEIERRREDLTTRTTMGQYETWAKHAGEDWPNQ
jgi:hypothetical protein